MYTDMPDWIEDVSFHTVKRNIIDDEHKHNFKPICYSADGEHIYAQCDCGEETVLDIYDTEAQETYKSPT